MSESLKDISFTCSELNDIFRNIYFICNDTMSESLKDISFTCSGFKGLNL